jgi:hypothetical protein
MEQKLKDIKDSMIYEFKEKDMEWLKGDDLEASRI